MPLNCVLYYNISKTKQLKETFVYRKSLVDLSKQLLISKSVCYFSFIYKLFRCRNNSFDRCKKKHTHPLRDVCLSAGSSIFSWGLKVLWFHQLRLMDSSHQSQLLLSGQSNLKQEMRNFICFSKLLRIDVFGSLLQQGNKSQHQVFTLEQFF